MIENPPANAGYPWVRKIPWSRETATHSSILAWNIPWTGEPGGLQSMESDTTEQTHTHTPVTPLLPAQRGLKRPEERTQDGISEKGERKGAPPALEWLGKR